MDVYDYLIVGGGIAGVTAAETIRERDSSGSVCVASEEPHPLYSRVLLPSYLKGKITREQVFLRRREDFKKNRIDLLLDAEAAFVDAVRKNVLLGSGERIAYKKLLIAGGGRVAPWHSAGDDRRAYRLHTLDDADRLKNALPRIQAPLVIGSSFIGLEFLEIFVLNGIRPMLASRDPHFFFTKIEERGGELFADNFSRHGVTAFWAEEVRTIRPSGDRLVAETESGRRIDCDAAAVGIGLERNREFLRDSGIALGADGIRTNEFLETSVPDVFAAGDIAEFYDVILGTHHCLGNWTNAFLQGKRAGLNMAGGREQFRAVSSYSITNLGFQITALGETSGASDAIVRSDKTAKEYERFFLRGGALAGAVLINRFQDRTHLARLIEQGTNIEEYREQMQEWDFDIRSLSA